MKLRILLSLLLLAATAAAQPSAGWSAVDSALGRKGSIQPGDVYKFALPRTDLHVTVGEVTLKPALALGGWLAFQADKTSCMAMGDLVVTENEVPQVIHAAMPAHVEITAIHNHVAHETPRVMYMHVGGHFTGASGNAACVEAAKALKDVIAAAEIPAPSTAPPPPPAELGFDQAAVEKALDAHGKVNGGVLQFGIPRAETITMHGMTIPPSMGTATAINFQPVGQGRAAITGDFVLTAGEVPKVMKALEAGGIAPTALHSHMLDEQPRLFFMHFWAIDDAAKLAVTLRKALDQTNSVKPQ